MSNFGCFLVFSILCTAQSFPELNIERELYDRVYDAPKTPAICKKDILLIVDTSYSIGEYSFNNHVKPFLENFVTEPSLNVGRYGTHLAMIIFNLKSKTKLLFGFGEKYNQQELKDYIDNLNWNEVSGGHTRTDEALRIANDKVFKETSPLNNRDNVDDVIVLLTDGEPRGAYGTLERTLKYAEQLKHKEVTIVTAGVGPTRKQFMGTLQKLASSKEYALEADFKNMNNIIGKLVESSCTKPGECTCAEIKAATVYVKPGESEAMFSWMKPQYSCMSGTKPVEQAVVVDPPVSSPHAFSVGNHTITYNFKLQGDVQVQCRISFEVKGELCRGVAFDSKTQVCCCGTIFHKKNGKQWKCCGPDYYDDSQRTCCSNANLVSKEVSCPSF